MAFISLLSSSPVISDRQAFTSQRLTQLAENTRFWLSHGDLCNISRLTLKLHVSISVSESLVWDVSYVSVFAIFWENRICKIKDGRLPHNPGWITERKLPAFPWMFSNHSFTIFLWKLCCYTVRIDEVNHILAVLLMIRVSRTECCTLATSGCHLEEGNILLLWAAERAGTWCWSSSWQYP